MRFIVPTPNPMAERKHEQPVKDEGFTIIVQQDFDRYFETWTREAIKHKLSTGQELKHTEFLVDAAPYRGSALEVYDAKDKPTRLVMEFYSVARHGDHGLYIDDPALMEWL